MTRGRGVLAAAAVACLVLAVLLAPRPVDRREGVLAAVGRSMGGARVMVIDGLFLRAEAERKAGRVEEAAALYGTALELDPANEVAAMFLSNLYVDELLPLVPDAEGRLRWWREARALAQRALDRHPDSAALHAHMAHLVLDAPRFGAGLAQRLERELGHPRLVALRHLLRAVRRAETLPRQGRSHLVAMVVLAPLVAAEALREGDREAEAEARSAAQETLSLRGEILGQMLVEAGSDENLRRLLQLGMAAVEATAQARRAGADPARARRLLEAYRALLPAGAQDGGEGRSVGLADVLEDVLGR